MFLHVPVYALSRALSFPSPDQAEEGLVAVGGDLSPERLLLAYRSGIFPWYDDGLPILWHSPDPRCVMPRRPPARRPHAAPRAWPGAPTTCATTRRSQRVIRACKKTPAAGQDGTWITDEMERAYVRLHALGYAHSVESWRDGELAGGLYGVSLGRVFFGESMFTWQTERVEGRARDARRARRRAGGSRFIDAQVPTPHTVAMGAEEWPRATVLAGAPARARPPHAPGELGEPEPALEG